MRQELVHRAALDALWPYIKDVGVGTEFANDLATRATRRASHIAIVDNRNRTNLHLLGSELGDRREDRGSLSTVG